MIQMLVNVTVPTETVTDVQCTDVQVRYRRYVRYDIVTVGGLRIIQMMDSGLKCGRAVELEKDIATRQACSVSSIIWS